MIPLFLLLITLLLSSCSSSISEPIHSFQVQTPRPFGYVIGDKITQRLLVEVRQGVELQYSSLPARGTINRWLNLNKVKINKKKASDGWHYQIDLTYQVFYAPLEVKMLDLPAFTLQFRQFGNTVGQEVPVWHFTTAPLRELAIRKDNGIEYMRPDQLAPLIDNSAVTTRLTIFSAITSLMAGYLAWLYGLLSFLPKYQIFKKPTRQLAKLTEGDEEKMLAIFHHALNRLNGKPLFKHQSKVFYQEFPRYKQLQSELDWFFDYSNEYFFGSHAKLDENNSHRIQQLSKHCLDIERGRR
ncbi:MAG: nonribosomal peptide synthetase MxaA [Methylococcales bacterium]|nr:nonribosomal peptide synthetase MxaA [Methylococcales bacterium]